MGQTFRKQGNRLHITPSKEGVQSLFRKGGYIIRKQMSAPMKPCLKSSTLFFEIGLIITGMLYHRKHSSVLAPVSLNNYAESL